MREWNDGQKAVLQSIEKDENILVSAAAGSGKTAVLVERIVSSVTEGRCGIDEILVVTFTKAAAAQMKGKITALLEERAYNSGDPKLVRQMSLAANADISTIDSFCNRIVRENFQAAGLDPGFDLFDAGEAELLREDVMDDVMDELYRDPEFADCVKVFVKDVFDDSQLRDILMRLFLTSETFADPEEWLKKNTLAGCLQEQGVEEEDEGYEETLLSLGLGQPWAAGYLEEIRKIASYLVERLKKARDLYAAETDSEARKTAEKIVKVLNSDLDRFGYFVKAQTLVDAAEGLGQKTERFMGSSYMKVYDLEEIEELAAIRKKGGDLMKTMLSGITAAGILQELTAHVRLEKQLLRAIRLFRENLLQEKKRRKKYEFNDIAHAAYRVLFDPEEKRVTPVGRRYARKYRYIYIDEYQDGSDIQEHILNSVARYKDGYPSNIFMVGDVKQSIYRFRQARPQLFLDKERAYRKMLCPGKVLYLNENYRSRKEVLEAANFVFRQLMREEFGGILYDENVQLNYPKSKKDTNFLKYLPEVLICDPSAVSDDGEAVEEAAEILEARMIGRRILSIVRGEEEVLIPNESFDDKRPEGPDNRKERPAGFGDIVILQRSVANSGKMLREYARMGIPVQLEDPRAYFDAEEVVTILSVLQVIDNSEQDIPYAAVLRSPIGKCTDAELALLALKRPDNAVSLYAAANEWLETEEDPEKTAPELRTLEEGLRKKTAALRQWILKWKKESRYLSIAELLNRILEDTGYRTTVMLMPNGKHRLNNLMQLIFKAEDFEKSGNHGLFTFLRYFEKCKYHELTFGETGAAEHDGDAVRICTIHSSKGLEYPIVFVARMGKQFNFGDYKKPITISADYGIAPNHIRKIAGKYWLSTKGIRKKAVNHLDEMDTLYEELRLLYVAMTRAKDLLILTGTRRKAVEEYRAASGSSGRGDIPYYVLASAKTYLDFVVPVLFRDLKETGKVFSLKVWPADVFAASDGDALQSTEEEAEDTLQDTKDALQDTEEDPDIPRQAASLQALHSFVYPYAEAVAGKTKLSVSELKHEAMDRLPQEEEEPERREKVYERRKTGVSASDYGTAIHKLMELLPYEEISSEADMVEKLQGLIDGPRFTEDLRKVLRADKIKQFYSDAPDSLFRRMKAAEERGQLFREQQFLMGIPTASDTDASQAVPSKSDSITSASDSAVLQGVIDAFFLEKDEEGREYAVLVDYKTDRVDSPETLKSLYRTQLELYAEAIRDITGLKVKEMWLYGFSNSLGAIRL